MEEFAQWHTLTFQSSWVQLKPSPCELRRLDVSRAHLWPWLCTSAGSCDPVRTFVFSHPPEKCQTWHTTFASDLFPFTIYTSHAAISHDLTSPKTKSILLHHHILFSFWQPAAYLTHFAYETVWILSEFQSFNSFFPELKRLSAKRQPSFWISAKDKIWASGGCTWVRLTVFAHRLNLILSYESKQAEKKYVVSASLMRTIFRSVLHRQSFEWGEDWGHIGYNWS